MTKKNTLIALGIVIVALPLLSFIWIQAYNRGYTRISNIQDQFKHAAHDEQGRIWVCYDVWHKIGSASTYVSVFQSDKLIATYEVNDEFDDSCVDIAVDKEGNVFVNEANYGVMMFDGKSWKTVWKALGSHQLGYYPYMLTVDNLGKVWVGSHNSLSVFDGKSWKTIETPEFGNEYYHLVFDNSGKIWVGSRDSLSIFDGNSWDNLGGGGLDVITFDKKNHAWLADFDDLYIFDATHYDEPLFAYSNSFVQINSIVFDKDGTAWITDINGLSTFDGKNKVDITSLISKNVGNLFFDNQGRTWIFDQSFMVFDGNEWKYYLTSDYLYNSTPLVNIDGRIWVSSQRGFAVLSPEELRLVSKSTATLMLFLTTGGMVFIVIILISAWLAYALSSWKGIGLGFSVGAIIGIVSILKTLSEYGDAAIMARQPFFEFWQPGFILLVGGVIGGFVGKRMSKPGKPNREVLGAFLGLVIVSVVFYGILFLLLVSTNG